MRKRICDVLTLNVKGEKKSTGIKLSAVEKEVDSSDNLEKSIDNEKKSTTDMKLSVAEKSTNSDSNIKKDDWRIKAEERRQAALAIRAAKKLKTEQQHHHQPIVTPVTNPCFRGDEFINVDTLLLVEVLVAIDKLTLRREWDGDAAEAEYDRL